MPLLRNLLKAISSLFGSNSRNNKVYVSDNIAELSEVQPITLDEIETIKPENKLEPLIYQIKANNRNGFIKLLNTNPALLNERDLDGNTILHYLVLNPNLTVALDVINSNHLNICTKNNDKKTPLEIINERLSENDCNDPLILVNIGRAIIRQVKTYYKEDEIPENFGSIKDTFMKLKTGVPVMKSESISRQSEPSSLSLRIDTEIPRSSFYKNNESFYAESLNSAVDINLSPKTRIKKTPQSSR